MYKNSKIVFDLKKNFYTKNFKNVTKSNFFLVKIKKVHIPKINKNITMESSYIKIDFKVKYNLSKRFV